MKEDPYLFDHEDNSLDFSFDDDENPNGFKSNLKETLE